ncbi:hypothetical protein CDL12_21121 [Handroanthus impetiginosus]|uniref:DUF4283 domain-containing protein n=1 Tax=Handroanthus impetiginosus TaxID=429701 RepID=A0A2G9GMU4_9LAMI|nr:hypothetical protein CDL12_21121 [Handroanthus impetiginosus]
MGKLDKILNFFEEREVQLSRLETYIPNESRRHVLVGKVVSSRIYSFVVLKANLAWLLQPIKGLDIEVIDNSRFLLVFQHPFDKKNAMEGNPLLLDKHALILNELMDGEDSRSVSLSWMQIVICVENISYSYL